MIRVPPKPRWLEAWGSDSAAQDRLNYLAPCARFEIYGQFAAPNLSTGSQTPPPRVSVPSALTVDDTMANVNQFKGRT